MAVPVDDPVLLEVLSCELSVDEPVEVDWVEVVEPDCALDVEPLAGCPDCVESAPVVDDVVVLAEPLVRLVVPSAGLLGAAPPGLADVEIPPVGRSVTLTVTVVVVAGVVVAACEPDDVADEVVAPVGPPVPGERVAGLAAGVAIAGARLLEAAVSDVGVYADASEAVTRGAGAVA